ncbi:MAG: double-cubane-cluster-containing anaerobic reductase [Syntrophomonadales bacterium]|jgi:benzoyl-CoA reductase/2-hydroxyglutaryl-CoA dehydratase subunit BcrC/BadD/HgdB
MRPAILDSFKDIREQNIMTLKQKKEAGTKVAGIYCGFCPRELVLAAGAIPVGLCGTRHEPIPAAEKDLPRNLCPLIKSSYGFAATDTCPYFHFSDLVIGETTCDGKKKMFEIMQKIKSVHVMHLPQIADQPSSLALWYDEIVRLKRAIEEQFQVDITDEAIREAIHITNEEARALKALFDLNTAKPALMTGTELLMTSFQVSFNADRWQGIAMVDNLVAEVRELARKGYHVGDENTPRVLMTGTPVGMGSEKVVTLVEECGGLVVAMQNCSGYTPTLLHIDESDPRDPIMLLAEKYIGIPCSVMSPNPGRRETLEHMISRFKIDGVIDLTWQACHTFNIESYYIAELVKDKLGLPFLHLETDYSDSDRETLRVRIEAFLEMI